MSIRSDALNWLYEGVEDLKTAEQLFKLERYAHACFHAQQAAEKALKAVIMAKLRKLARGHDLVELYSQVEHLLSFPVQMSWRNSQASTCRLGILTQA